MSPFLCLLFSSHNLRNHAKLSHSSFFTAQTPFINTHASLLNYRALDRIFGLRQWA
jgi:hypothetical protein